MGTVKISVLEVDGVEYDTVTEMDLLSALSHIGFSQNGFSEDLILCDETFNSLYDQDGNILIGV